MSLTSLLLGALNESTQKVSEEALKNAERTNFTEFLKALASELNDPTKPPLALRSAGVILKNYFFDTRSETARKAKIHQWNTVDEASRNYIKVTVLKSVVSPIEEARAGAAQVLGGLGCVELEHDRWPELIPSLSQCAESPSYSDDVKIHVLQSMGYLCEFLDPHCVSEADTNLLLTSVVNALKPIRMPQLRLASITALCNMLDFASPNMAREAERALILDNIASASSEQNGEEIRCIAFDCMSRVVELYYSYLTMAYVSLFGTQTFQAIRAFSQFERPALRAMEFWLTMCEVEMDFSYDGEEEASQKFIASVAQPLVQLATETCLMQQNQEMNDDDEWNVSMAGGMLLQLMALVAPEPTMAHTLPFVKQTLPQQGAQLWRQREAGIMAFASILEGPNPDSLTVWVREALPLLCALTDPAKETVPQVRDTSAYCLGVMLTNHFPTLQDQLNQIAQCLVLGLDDPEAMVASKCAGGFEALGLGFDREAMQERNKLSEFIPVLLPKLVATCKRIDGDRGELRRHAYEAMNCLVTSAAQDMLPILSELLMVILQQLHQALSFSVQTSAQREEVEDVIRNCCGTIQVIIRRQQDKVLPQHVDGLVLLMNQILTQHPSATMDAHLVLGALAGAIHEKILHYFPSIVPHVILAIQNPEEWQACQTATELFSDLCRAVKTRIASEIPVVLPQILQNLGNHTFNRAIKSPSLFALGEIALALGSNFEPFAESVLACLENANAQLDASLQTEDSELVEYINELRQVVLEAYVSIMMALTGQAGLILFQSNHCARMDALLRELALIAQRSRNNTEFPDTIKAACGLLGDLITYQGQAAKAKIQSALPVFSILIECCITSQDPSMVEVGQTTKNLLTH